MILLNRGSRKFLSRAPEQFDSIPPVIPNAVGNNAPDVELDGFHDEPVGVFSVGRAQHGLTPHECEVLDQRLLVNDADDDLTCFRVKPLVDDQQITTEDPRPLHAVAFDLHQVSTRRADVQELIE